jgi:tripartite-type tricarboxylate transporter receptor subunit TctC
MFCESLVVIAVPGRELLQRTGRLLRVAATNKDKTMNVLIERPFERTWRVRFGVALSALVCALASVTATMVFTTSAAAESVEDFYKGKTITISVGFSPGGSYDFYSRLFARYMGKYLPGHPTIVVQNMPGAGSLRAANYLYNVAPKDGTALGVVTQTLMIEGPLGTAGVKFDAAKFSYLGRMTGILDTISGWYEAKAKTIYDVRKYETVIGGTGATSVTVGYGRLLNAFAGTKFRALLGFGGTTDIMLAMQRREVDAVAVSLTTLTRGKKDWLDEKKINIMVQVALERSKDLPDVPTLVELGNSDQDKAALTFYTSTAAVSRSLIGAPDIPADRVKALRDAFMATTRDPDFVADVNKMGSEFDPAPGEYLENLAKKVSATPVEIARRTAAALHQK